jgi:hypothetical protein
MAAHVEAIRSARTYASSRPLLAYWHLLSLDAATVAVVWCVAFARAAGVHLPATSPLALGAIAWILYVSDRLLDVRRGEWLRLRERHWVHARHRRWLVAPLVAAAFFLTWVVVRQMPAAVLRADCVLGCAALLYFARVHLGPHFALPPLAAPWKELTVGTIFALAVAIPALACSLHPWALALPVAEFAALCFLNCLLIEEAETSTDSQWTAAALVALALLCFLTLLLPGAERWLPPCIGGSAGGLRLLGSYRRRLSPLNFRIAADAALLTPLLLLPWLRV